MSRNWDEELAEDRSFKIGGETFHWRELHHTESSALWKEYTKPAENGKRELDFSADVDVAIERILNMLETEDRPSFKKLMARKTNPVPRHQIMQLYHWLFELVSGLPTTPPSPSAAGGGKTDEGSSAGTSSKAATPAA